MAPAPSARTRGPFPDVRCLPAHCGERDSDGGDPAENE
jgi:hypothetical protein